MDNFDIPLGIQDIASFIPENKISNYERKNKFEVEDDFIEEKIGVRSVAIKNVGESASDLCMKAYENLTKKVNINKNQIRVLVVVTQNPDFSIPHASAILHGKLDLNENCACFDLSLGCSGYVYGLSIIQNFMMNTGAKLGLLFTADPYSEIIDSNDKNTALLFGDASAVTLISANPSYRTGIFSFGTSGKNYEQLMSHKGKLIMNGRGVFNFSAKYVPSDVLNVLKMNNMDIDDINKFVFHQGSKYIVDTISRRLKLRQDRVIFDISDYGNTVSSSIPIILEKLIGNRSDDKNILISGFGVGLSWASTILKKT